MVDHKPAQTQKESAESGSAARSGFAGPIVVGSHDFGGGLIRQKIHDRRGRLGQAEFSEQGTIPHNPAAGWAVSIN